jgi:RND superfamily putative drug exporter
MLFLRALLAPVYLLAASVLAVLATLGLTVVICDAVFGSPDLVYFVPFAAGVLLVSLGSDYNVFVVGRIWEEARTLPARDAVAVGVMLDSVVVRSFLVAALVALTGRFGMWPGHQRVRVAARRPPELSDASR